MFSNILDDLSDEKEVEKIYYCIEKTENQTALDLPLDVGDLVNIIVMDDHKYWYGHIKDNPSKNGMIPRTNIVSYDSKERIEFEKLQKAIKTGIKPSRPPKVNSCYSTSRSGMSKIMNQSFSNNLESLASLTDQNKCMDNYNDLMIFEDCANNMSQQTTSKSCSIEQNQIDFFESLSDKQDYSSQLDKPNAINNSEKMNECKNDMIDALKPQKPLRTVRPFLPAITNNQNVRCTTISSNSPKRPDRPTCTKPVRSYPSNFNENLDSEPMVEESRYNTLPDQKFISSKKNTMSISGLKKSFKKITKK